MHIIYKPSRRQFLAGALTAGAVLSCGLGAFAEIALSQPPGNPFSSELKKAMDAALDEGFAQGGAPGAVAGIWQGEKGVWTAVRGATTLKGQQPPTLELHTRVGSITKTMVGTLILQLIDEGKLDIDQTVESWFPKLPMANKISVRMLGTMASGIASYTFSDKFTDQYFAHPQQSWTPDQLLEIAFGLPREFEPGKGFQYCNTNFVMLGVMVEKLRGKPLGEALQEHIFDQLGMAHSSYPHVTDLPDPYWRGWTLQGTPDGTTAPVDATNWSPTFGAGAGQAVSSFRDLRSWAKALGTGLQLKPETQALRMEPNTYSSKGARSYCFGVGNENGWVSHAGTLPGYNTQVGYLPGQDITIVVMTNTDTPGTHGLPAVGIFNALTGVVAPEHKTATV